MSLLQRDEQPLIVRLLGEHGVLDEAQREEANRARMRFPDSTEEALVLSELADESDIARVHAENLGLPWLELVRDDDGSSHVVRTSRRGERKELGTVIEVGDLCRSVAERFSETACRKHKVIPVWTEDGRVDLACLDPSHFSAIEEVRMRAGCVVRPQAATLSLINDLIDVIFGERDMVREIAGEASGATINDQQGEDDVEVVVDLLRPIPNTKDSQVIRIANILLAGAVEEGASDIHLEPYEDSVRVRYRVDGKLRETTPPPKALFIPTISRLKILAKMDIAEKRVPQDGAITLKHGESRIDLRVSTVPTVYGEKMVIRLLKKDAIPDSLEQLGFSAAQAHHFIEAARSPHGLMFVTGPTGSGKSTTLYCCLNLINESEDNIVTVEDPVEYKFRGLNQVNVRAAQGLTFASALRSFLRQDPDKIMVGEVRDQETAQICMRAALTGHLVLSTLHTNDSLQAVTRLVDMGIEPFLLGPALRLVEAQRLARRLCSECKEAYVIPGDVAERHGLEEGLELFRANPGGCTTCSGRGYKGRTGLYEVIPINDQIKEVIAQGKSGLEIRAEAKLCGIEFLEDDARRKLIQGHTSLDEVSEYIRVDT